MTGPTYYRAIELLEADLNDELVALDTAQGNCFGFNSVAASVWHNLKEPRSFDQLREALLQEYSVDPEQCARELQELLDDLTAKGLIKIAR